MKNGHIKNLISLYKSWSGNKAESINPLPPSGSQRKYYRIQNNDKPVIGAYNPDKKENQAFIYLSKHFLKNKLNVPKIFSTDLNKNIYLLEDLGDQTVYSFIEATRSGKNITKPIVSIYKEIIEELPKFQVLGSNGLDYSKCYPRPAFDKQSIMWDLNYFKYSYLKPSNIPFDEQKLEDNFNFFAEYLLQADSNYFMYRDFNTRNIMMKNNELYFIDYQGGRRGPLQYDIASLLFSSRADIPFEIREQLLEHYIKSVSRIERINSLSFKKYYYEFVLIRILQMLGAYGYRGYFEGKAHFLQSIPYALKNLEYLNSKNKIKIKSKIKELMTVIERFITSENNNLVLRKTDNSKLTVTINSFSYRNKIPTDYSGHGGGFVFDCRAIPNPGRLEQYKSLTGMDKPVQDFLNSQREAKIFLKDTFDLVDQSVQSYIERNWTNLIVNYGCTGGQHRSVYCAEKLAKHVKQKFDVNVLLVHTEQRNKLVTKKQSY